MGGAAAVFVAVSLTLALGACAGGEKKASPVRRTGRILFVSDRGSTNAGCAFLGGDGCETDVYVVDADGTKLLRISTAPGADGSEGGAVWSPDGKRIAYVRTGNVHEEEGAQPEVIVVNADGSGQKSLGSWGFVGGPGSEPQWSPDGTRVAFAGGDGYVIAQADGSGRTLFARDLVYAGPAAFIGGTVWSPDGKRVALAFGDALYVSDPDGKHRVALARSLKDYIPLWAWSPDGTLIAFTQATGTYVASADGSGATRVHAKADSTGLQSAPAQVMAWADGGRRLVTERAGDLVAVNPDGTDVQSLTSSPEHDVSPVVSPSGSKILFLRTSYDGQEFGNATLYVVNSDGSGLRMLVAPEVGSANWSPDGKWIVYARRPSASDNNQEIYVMSADGTGIRNITNNDAGETTPKWAPLK
jgi:Tol biopolymer transport system component